MTNDDWEKMEEDLSHVFGMVALLCDGYRVSFRYAPIKKRLVLITGFVNGWFKGEWLLNDCEERRRFFRKESRYALSPKLRKEFKKMGKRVLKQANIDLEQRHEYYTFRWSSFNQLKKHLIANNQTIEIEA